MSFSDSANEMEGGVPKTDACRTQKAGRPYGRTAVGDLCTYLC